MDSQKVCIELKAGQQVNPKFVPAGRSATTAATPASITAKAQEPVFLRYLYVEMGVGVVNDVKVGNQSLNCSDSDISFALFQNDTQRKPLVGLAVDGKIQMAIDVTTDGDSAVTAAFSYEDICRAPAGRRNQQIFRVGFGIYRNNCNRYTNSPGIKKLHP